MSIQQKKLAVFLVFLITLFASSCSTTPHVRFQAPSEKVGLKVALIISEEFRNKVYEGTAYGSCVAGRYTRKQKGTIQFRNTAGEASEELFVKGLSHLFDRVDVYRTIGDIKNRGNYDYILIPYSEISTSSDQKSRTIWRLSASAEYQVYVKDIKTDTTIVTFTGKGFGTRNWEDIIGEWGTRETYCAEGYNNIRRERWINLRFSEAYQSPMGDAMSKAFEDLIGKMKIGLLPADIFISANFSDRNSLLPNNTLDVGEDAELVVTAMNKGKGIGYGTNLEVASDNSKIAFEKNITIGDIPPGETRDIRINLKAGKDIGDGKAIFNLNLKEKLGYNAKSVALSIPTSNQINRSIDNIVAKIISQMRQKGWERIAIAEIKPIDSSYAKLNSYLLEEFYTRFRQIKGITVVEKNLIDKALIKIGSSFSNLIRPSSETNFFINRDAVKEFSKLTEADAIFYWVIVEASGERRIKTYLVDIDKGKIF